MGGRTKKMTFKQQAIQCLGEGLLFQPSGSSGIKIMSSKST